MVEGEGQSQNINSLTKIDKKCVYIYIYICGKNVFAGGYRYIHNGLILNLVHMLALICG